MFPLFPLEVAAHICMNLVDFACSGISACFLSVQVGDRVRLRVPKPSGLLRDGDVGVLVSSTADGFNTSVLQTHRISWIMQVHAVWKALTVAE